MEENTTQNFSIGWLILNTEGRLNRKPYIIFIMISFIILLFLFACAKILSKDYEVASAISYIMYFIFTMPAKIKRCHDRGRS